MTERLPLFPLGTVLYPGLVLPLHIFEERYRTLVADLTAPEAERGDAPGAFGVVAIRAGHETAGPEEEQPTLPDIYEVGCTAELRRVEELPDGRYDLVTTGSRRFRVHGVDAGGAYLVGQVEPLEEDRGDAADVLARSVGAHYLAYRDALLDVAGQAPRVRGPLPSDPVVLSYLVAAAMVLDIGDKQRLLEATDATARLRAELDLLRRERAVLGHLPSLPGTDLTRDRPCPN